MVKKVAFTQLSARTCNTWLLLRGNGPSSKVSTTSWSRSGSVSGYCMVPIRGCSRGSTTSVREVPIASGCPGQSAADALCAARPSSNPRHKGNPSHKGNPRQSALDRRARHPKEPSREPSLVMTYRPHCARTRRRHLPSIAERSSRSLRQWAHGFQDSDYCMRRCEHSLNGRFPHRFHAQIRAPR